MGWCYLGTREYAPRTARWLQRDPIDATSGDPNLYRYCGNDPVNLADSDGLESEAKNADTSAGRQASDNLQDELSKNCEKWIKEMEEAIKYTREKIQKYNPETDARGGWPSQRKQGQPTVPHGHKKELHDRRNQIARLVRNLGRCLGHPQYKERAEQLREEGRSVVRDIDNALSRFSMVPHLVPQPLPVPTNQSSCNSPAILDGAQKGVQAVGIGVLLYLIISEGSRVLFPPRNLVPVP